MTATHAIRTNHLLTAWPFSVLTPKQVFGLRNSHGVGIPKVSNRYHIFLKTDTDTNVSICNTEKYRIPTIKYRKAGSVRYFI